MPDAARRRPVAPPFGVLLVAGSHTHQESYARALAADPRCRLVAVTDENDVSEERRHLNVRLARELNLPYVDDLEAALSRDDVQIASVCCESERIARVIVRCARAGKHVYADKPVAASATQARTVVEAVETSDVCCQMFSLVHTPPARRCRAIVDSGRLGRLVGLHCELFFAKGRAGSADLSQRRIEKLPVTRYTFADAKRELQCVGVYPLVLFPWLGGRRFETVEALTANYFFAEHQRHDVEDFGCAVLRMHGGVEASIVVGRTGWTSHPSSGIHHVRLVGADGVVDVDAFRPRLEVYANKSIWEPPDPHPEDAMGFWASSQLESGVRPKRCWRPVEAAIAGDAAAFIDCVENGLQPAVDAALAAHSVETLDAAYESAACKQAVAIE